jgi:hypothetical protein
VARRTRTDRRGNGGAVRPAREGALRGRGYVTRGAVHGPVVASPLQHALERGHDVAARHASIQFGLARVDRVSLPNFKLKCTKR